MAQIIIKQPRDYSAAIGIGLFLPIFGLRALPLSQAQFSQLAFACMALLFVIVRIWVEVVRGYREVEIDTERAQVVVRSVSAFFRKREKCMPLSEFCEVRSYLTGGRFSKNRLELKSATSGVALVLADFPPGRNVTRWIFPQEIESDAARFLRIRISKECGLKDVSSFD